MNTGEEKVASVDLSGSVNLREKVRSRLSRGNVFTRVVLTSRDEDVLKFLLEMRFATREELFRRFFETTLSGATATSPEFMRRRLIELEKLNLVQRTRNFATKAVHYLATEKAQKFLRAKYPDQFFPSATKEIYWVNYFHDTEVMKARVEFEKELGITEWISDHSLKSLSKKQFGLKTKFSPDGVYRLPSGDRVAFELENSRKAKKIYREKIHAMEKVMKARSDDPSMFRRVHFRCLSEQVYRLIKYESEWFGSSFQIELAAQKASQS